MLVTAWNYVIAIVNFAKRVLILSPIAIFFTIVAVEWVTFVFVFQARRFDEHPFLAVFLVILFSIIGLLMLMSYSRCVMTSNAPRDNPSNHELDESEYPPCIKCSSLKPERTHHCSMCGDCVLKMDHHCPWIANCVGQYNYKYFILFLFWCWLGCLVYIAGVGSHIVLVFRVLPIKPSTLDLLALFGVISCLAFGLTLIPFILFHLYLVVHNLTTLEYTFIFRSSNPFNHGWRQNLEDVFGPDPWYWLLPINTSKLTGWDYNVDLLEYERSLLLSNPAPELVGEPV